MPRTKHPGGTKHSGRRRQVAAVRTACSISGSPTSTRLAASPSGTNESRAATRHARPVVAVLDEAGQHGLADPAGVAGLVDHDDAADRPGVLGDDVDRQRRQPAQVEHAARDAVGGEALGHPQRQVQAVGPRRRRARPRPRGRSPARRSGRARSPTPPARRTAPSTARRRRGGGRGCGTSRSAPGTRSPCRRHRPRPRTCAASAAASAGWAGEAMTRPGMSRSTATALSLWKWPPNPFW